MDLPYDDKQAAIYGDSFKAIKQEAFGNLVLSVRQAISYAPMAWVVTTLFLL